LGEEENRKVKGVNGKVKGEVNGKRKGREGRREK